MAGGFVMIPQHATLRTPTPIVAGVILNLPLSEIHALAKKPNYNLEKNRREQDRKKKKEEKRLRRLENSRGGSAEAGSDEPDDAPAPPAEEA
jgi:hypothetical protein